MLLAASLCLGGCRETSSETPRERDPEPPQPPAASMCGGMECKPFSSSSQAIASLLERRPLVIAFGESHALRGVADVLTATERFGGDYLPLLSAKGASTLVVELINPPSGCEKEKAAVAAVQQPVVERQDDGNQERFIQLGHRARELNMVPLILEPTCADFAPVSQAGPDGVAALLELIAVQTRDKLERLAARVGPGAFVVAYGGGIHNDIATEGETKPFAFGAALNRATSGRYIAVDLIVPEFVGDNDVWKALPWYQHWPRLAEGGVVLIETRPNEFTLILERGKLRQTPNSVTTAPTNSGGANGATSSATSAR